MNGVRYSSPYGANNGFSANSLFSYSKGAKNVLFRERKIHIFLAVLIQLNRSPRH